jgi:autotransporter-associated beta strand protein
MKTSMIKKMAGLGITAAVMLSGGAMFGQSTWTGAAGDGKWSSAVNWDEGVPVTLTTAIFNITGTTIDTSDASVKNINFTEGAGSFEFNSAGTPFTIGSGTISIASTVSSATMTFGGLLTLNTGNGAVAFMNASTDSVFNITGNITGNTSETGGVIQLGTRNINGNGTISGNITQGANSLLSIVKDGTSTWTISGDITTTGSVNVTQGRLNLSGNNSGLSGNVTLGNNTTIGIGSATALGTGTLTLGRGNLLNLTGATFTASNNMIWTGNNTLNINTEDNTGNINLTGTMTVLNNGASIQVLQSSTLTLGTVTGEFKLTKAGNAGAGQGTLIINHSQNNGEYTVNSGALVVDDQLITLNGDASTILSLTAAPANNGSFTLNSLTFDLSGANVTDGQTWEIYNNIIKGNPSTYLGADFAVNGFTNSDENIWTLVDGTDTWSFAQLTGVLSVAQIPEPSVWTLLGLGAGLLVWVGYRQRKARGGKNHLSCGVILLLLTFAARTPAQIQWQTPTPLTGDDDVLANGTLLYAFNYGAADTTVNGITFTGITSQSDMDIHADQAAVASSANGGSIGFTDYANIGFANFTALSADYQALLSRAVYPGGYTAPLLLTVNNLTIGETYQIQYFINDSRTENIEYSSRSVTVALDNIVSAPVRFGQDSGGIEDGGKGTLGNFLVGTFVADDTSAVFTITGQIYPQLNAFALLQIPEPSNWILLSVGAVLLLWTAHRRRQASV